MPNSKDMPINYSDLYREHLSAAITNSKELGFARPSLISRQVRIGEDSLRQVNELVSSYSDMLDSMLPGYWGNSCQTLSSHLFSLLNSHEIDADIVLGTVIINGHDEFGVTLESLTNEFCATEPLTGHQVVHAWISLGDDTVVDAALPPRLVSKYRAPEKLDDVIFVGRAQQLGTAFDIQYCPVLVGSEFFAKTNPPDPVELLEHMRRLMRFQPQW